MSSGEPSADRDEQPGTRSMRLNRYLALCGAAARRQAMELVFAGRVQVNGVVVRDPGQQVCAARDRIELDGERVRAPEQWHYYVFHKPRGVIVSTRDEYGREALAPVLRRIPAHVFPVGRLDRSSEGLLLLTNHGELAYALLHPRNQIEKLYRVRVSPRPRPEQLERLTAGVPIGRGERSHPAHVRLKRAGSRVGLLSLAIHEGKKHEVRRMCRAVGLRVLNLRRVAFAGIRLATLPPGALRPLTQPEIEHLRSLTGLDL